MVKKIAAAILSFTMLLSGTAYAKTVSADEAAESLYDLGLLNGTGIDEHGNPQFDLDRSLTRQEAVILLCGMLGKDKEAIEKDCFCPFTDVDYWAKPYVGYAYSKKLVNGISHDKFSGRETVTAAQFLTFVLNALEYECGTDFEWDKAWILSDALDITNGEYNEKNQQLYRGEAILIFEKALSVDIKDKEETLFESLNIQKDEEKPEQFNEGKQKDTENKKEIGYIHSGSKNSNVNDEDDSNVYRIEKTIYPQYDNKRDKYFWKLAAEIMGDFDSNVIITDYIIHEYIDGENIFDNILDVEDVFGGITLYKDKSNKIEIDTGMTDEIDKQIHYLKGTDEDGNIIEIEITYNLISDLDEEIMISENFPLPEELKSTTLTTREIKELIENKDPSEIKNKIKTVADLINYCVISEFKRTSGDYKVYIDGGTWHTNISGRQALELNSGNCGGFSNLAAYTLAGDYDEIGFVHWEGEGGGHIINYVKEDKVYYVFDMQQTIGLYDERGEYNFKYTKLYSEDEFDKLIDIYGLKEQEDGEDYQVASYLIWHSSENGSGHIPTMTIIDNDKRKNMGIPNEEKDNINSVYIQDGYKIHYKDVPEGFPDWTSGETIIEGLIES